LTGRSKLRYNNFGENDLSKNYKKNKKKVLDKAVPAHRLKRATAVMLMIFTLLIGRIRMDTVCSRCRT
jgi:hypothetical protein